MTRHSKEFKDNIIRQNWRLIAGKKARAAWGDHED